MSNLRIESNFRKISSLFICSHMRFCWFLPMAVAWLYHQTVPILSDSRFFYSVSLRQIDYSLLVCLTLSVLTLVNTCNKGSDLYWTRWRYKQPDRSSKKIENQAGASSCRNKTRKKHPNFYEPNFD